MLYANELNFLLGFHSYIQNQDHLLPRIILTAVRVIMVWTGLFVRWGIGQWLLLTAALIYSIEFIAALLRPATTRASLSFTIGHLSVLNFMFGLPGIVVGSPVSFFVIAINTLLVVYTTAYILFAFDWNRAWGCYGSNVPFHDLDGGYCPGYPGAAEDTGFMPKHCIDAFNSNDANDFARCRPGATPLKLDRFVHIVTYMLSASTGIYFGSIPTKFKQLKLLLADSPPSSPAFKQ